jgi:hypothetical protein
VRSFGTVSQTVIDGFGGDPAIDYRYTVAGRTYSGHGKGELGGEHPLALHPGDKVAIEYSAREPSASCTCNARSDFRRNLPVNVALTLLLLLPLGLVLRCRYRWKRGKSVLATAA